MQSSAVPVDPGHPVTFTTADGVMLNGVFYGHGSAAVNFSNMDDQHPASWTATAQAVAAAGYLALTYDFRYWVNGKMETGLMSFVADE